MFHFFVVPTEQSGQLLAAQNQADPRRTPYKHAGYGRNNERHYQHRKNLNDLPERAGTCRCNDREGTDKRE